MTTEQVHFNALYVHDVTGDFYIVDTVSQMQVAQMWLDSVNYRQFDNCKRWFVNPEKHYVRPIEDFKAKFTLVMRDVI